MHPPSFSNFSKRCHFQQRRLDGNGRLTDLQHGVDASGLEQLEALAEGEVLVVGLRRHPRGGHPRQGGVHAYVALVARKRPVDDAPLHRLRDAVVALLDALERDVLGDDARGEVQQRRREPHAAGWGRWGRRRRHGGRDDAYGRAPGADWRRPVNLTPARTRRPATHPPPRGGTPLSPRAARPQSWGEILVGGSAPVFVVSRFFSSNGKCVA